MALLKYLWRNGRVLNEKSRFRLRFLSLHSGATITLKSSCAICPDGLVQIKSTIFGRSQRLDIFDEQGMSVAENTLQRDLFHTS
ncbi:unnamed protein product [Oikopleura dioica]|uniref:Uncharacterized protein n=1 Tax=Oikopleura dioica TaxID=34765 RepID=E4X6E9_OIKDI|nr:unnamed protein product [Oikopleura dioica]